MNLFDISWKSAVIASCVRTQYYNHSQCKRVAMHRRLVNHQTTREIQFVDLHHLCGCHAKDHDRLTTRGSFRGETA